MHRAWRIGPRRQSGRAMEQATGLIEGGPTPVSQQLPSERELVNQLGVCRAAVREALTVLEAQGLIDVQPGRGAYLMVTAARADIVSGIVGWLNSHGREYEEVNELIRLLEGYAASLAARTAS